MKNEKLLSKLYESQKNGIKLLELIEQIKEEIKIEELPDITPKKQYTAAKKFLNQKNLERRPLLKLTHLENGYQVFTDSYMLFRFYNDSIIEQLPHTQDEDHKGKCGTYPQTEKLCGVFTEGTKSKQYNVLKLKQLIKTLEKNNMNEKPFDFEFENGKMRIDGIKLEKLFAIMNMKNNVDFSFLYFPCGKENYTVRTVGIKQGDKEAIILPMRVL